MSAPEARTVCSQRGASSKSSDKEGRRHTRLSKTLYHSFELHETIETSSISGVIGFRHYGRLHSQLQMDIVCSCSSVPMPTISERSSSCATRSFRTTIVSTQTCAHSDSRASIHVPAERCPRAHPPSARPDRALRSSSTLPETVLVFTKPRSLRCCTC